MRSTCSSVYFFLTGKISRISAGETRQTPRPSQSENTAPITSYSRLFSTPIPPSFIFQRNPAPAFFKIAYGKYSIRIFHSTYAVPIFPLFVLSHKNRFLKSRKKSGAKTPRFFLRNIHFYITLT